LLCILLFGNAARAAPRVLSADYCADQYVLALADEADIAALSPDADSDFSYLRARAHGLPQVRPEAEEAARIAPDLAVRFWGGSAQSFERLGIKVLTLEYAADFDAVKRNIEVSADALGRTERGEALVAEMHRRLAALKARGTHDVAALYVTPGGVTAGRGTFVDALFAAAGVRNAAGDRSGWSALPLEALIAHPPEMIVAGFFSAASETRGNWSAVRHPAFAKIFLQTPAVRLDADVLSCPGWFALVAAEEIARAAERLDD
jgi:iron complex transport system substrate-binding protein